MSECEKLSALEYTKQKDGLFTYRIFIQAHQDSILSTTPTNQLRSWSSARVIESEHFPKNITLERSGCLTSIHVANPSEILLRGAGRHTKDRILLTRSSKARSVLNAQ